MRAALSEIVVRVEAEHIEMVLHWQGGDHTALDVSVMTASRMVRRGIVKGRQICLGAPWAIKAEDVAAYRARNEPQRPLTADSAQGCFDFQ